MIWTGALLAMAVSIDSLGVGTAYAMRRIRLPASCLLIVGLLSGAFMTLSMVAGSLLSAEISSQVARLVGGAILVAIGCWQFLRGVKDYVAEQAVDEEAIVRLKLQPLGIIITILRDPVQADVNRSGRIDLRESILLGIALGMDAFGAGFGAALAGFGYDLIPLVALGCMLFVYLGQILGENYLTRWFGSRGYVLPGVILISLGVTQMF